MNKTDKYISQLLAKKIHDKAKEKGFELPESECVYVDFGKEVILVNTRYQNTGDGIVVASGYDIAELGEILNKAFKKIGKGLIFDPRGYMRRYIKKMNAFEDEAETRGKLFYYLLKNDLL